MKKVIATVGTSLFTNYLSQEIKYCLGDKYLSIEDEFEKLKNISASSYEEPKYRNYIEDIKRIISDKWLRRIKKADGNWEITNSEEINYFASAEITSLKKIFEELNGEEISVVLFTSDTILSKLAAEIISENVAWAKGGIDTALINGLTISNKTTFIKKGLNKLFDELEKIINNSYEELLLNITGGFKAVIPYMTIWGQINKVEIYYIFEESDQLIKIPQMPIDINYGLFEKYSHIFMKLDNVVSSSRKEFLTENGLKYDEDFPKNLVIEERDGDETLLFLEPSAQILWKKYNNLITIKIVSKSGYFELNNKKEIERAFRTLHSRLLAIDNFNLLKDDKLKHLSIEDTWIYKYNNNKQQIRIQYKWVDKKLSIFNFIFITSKHDDKEYAAKMAQEYKNIKNKNIEIIKI